MKKLINGALALTLGMLVYSCIKEEFKNVNGTDQNKANVVEDLTKIFNEVENDKVNTANKSSSKLSVPLANKQNPFNSTGVQHNEALRYLISLELTESNVCSSILSLNKEFGTNININCDEFLSLIQSGANKTFDEQGNYKTDLLDALLNENKISNNEYLVVNTTIENVYDLDNLNQKIALLKASENYTRNSQFLTESEKERIQRTFAIYRYSTYYWEVEEAALAAGPIANLADAMAEYWALNSPDSPAQDGSDVYAIASIVSSVFVALGY